MSIFDKPVSQVGTQDLQELLTEQAVENVRLEFKREVPDKDETLKKLSGFANTYGGFTIIGAEANSADGRIIGLPGVEVERSYKQTLVQWCFGGVAPPIEIEVSDPIQTPSGNGKVFYVIYTAESELAPHFLNGRKGVYVRTNEFSARFEPRLATENELRHLLDRRELVRQRRSELIRRAQERFRVFAEKRYDESDSGRKIGSRFALSVIPRFPARQLCEHTQILSLLETTQLDWRGSRFPGTRDLISQHESAISLSPGENFSMLEANVWGLLFYATEIELVRDPHHGIHLYSFVGHLLVFIQHAAKILGEIGYVGPLLLDTRLESMRGVKWFYAGWSNDPTTGPASELDDDITFSIVTTSETLAEKPDRIAMDILRYVFFATNWANAADNLDTFVKKGYKFNSWPVPDKLRV